ncbi:MAG: phenylalanine--tRNA ligase subunit beta [Candidatus Moranbacteria bacterium]|nr:phenylalanine--tRNA ligase subunit beta [Candidatus Moranbacteria bacterium]
MKYSYNWLKELSDTKLSPEKAAELLTMHSFEIEGLEKNNASLDGVVVGEILEITKHPNADKLQIATVETRHASSRLQIVCGAPNIAVGQKVPVAVVGTKLSGGEIKEAEIRGVKSFGMLCAEDELGLGESHAGILILDKKAKVGEPVAKYLGGADDSVLEIKVLPDRAHDILSHVGVARELSVLEKKKFSYAFNELILPTKKSQKLKVEIKDKDLCKRYVGVVMENITIKESPRWLKDRLEICGLRPINNVVDATNYVMLELGQPLHAFDMEKVSSQGTRNKEQETNKLQNSKFKAQIIVRRAKNNEMLTLLDDSKIKLNESNLLITNGDDALALAGIMGGKDSGISENTKTIVLEAASFDAVNIRRTRTVLGLNTDSSYRFEKDLDPNLTEKAMVRVIDILEHIAGGKIEGIADIYPKKISPWTVRLDLEYANQLLGENVPLKELVSILNLLGIHTKYQIPASPAGRQNTKYSAIACTIPTYRLDLRTQEDLIEDIGRIWGYEKIVPRPMIAEVLPAKLNEQVFFERIIQDKLTGLGFDEMYNYSFYGADDLKKTGFSESEHLELANPMNPDQQFVRAKMTVNILKNVRENLKNFSCISIFEIGKRYMLKNGEPAEERNLILAKVLEKDSNSETFYNLKGTTEDLLEAFNIKNTQFLEIEKSSTILNPGRSAKIVVGGKAVGFVGEVSQMVCANYKISKHLAIAEINLEVLRDVAKNTLEYQPINKFPVVSRDISMIVPKDIKYAQIETLVKKTGGELVNNILLFDRFEAKNSMAIRIEMSAKDRTLESAEIDAVMEKIIPRLKNDLSVEVRK